MPRGKRQYKRTNRRRLQTADNALAQAAHEALTAMNQRTTRGQGRGQGRNKQHMAGQPATAKRTTTKRDASTYKTVMRRKRDNGTGAYN